MHLHNYLIYDGQAEAAFKFYADCLGGEIVAMMPFADMPDGAADIPAEYRGRIMHASLRVGDQTLMASDNHPSQPYSGISGAYVSLTVDDTAQAQRIFDALADGGAVQMPLQETFWAQRFGMVVDRFGAAWMVNCDKPGAS